MGRHTLRMLYLAPLAIACGADSKAICPEVVAGTQEAIVLEATAEQLTAQGNIELLIVDEGDLYWYDDSGAILKLPRGASRVQVLRAAPGGFVGDTARRSEEYGLTINGFISDADHLYWGEASRYTGLGAGSVEGVEPPGRLLSIPKNGGSEQVLLDSAVQTWRPVGGEASRIILRSEGGYFQFDTAVGGLPKALPFDGELDTSRVVGRMLYWTELGQDRQTLFRTGLDEGEPERVAQIEGSDFEVGSGYILWRQESLQTEPELVLRQNLVMLDEATGCERALPDLGESISFTMAVDGNHAYWYSFNAIGGEPASTVGEAPAEPSPAWPLIRVNLTTGLLERLDVPELSLDYGSQIVGQDSGRVYISTSIGLFAVNKPGH